MAKAKTPSFVLTLKLNTSKRDETVLYDRFFAGFVMHNKLVKHARKALASLRQDEQYRKLMGQYVSLGEKMDTETKQLRATLGKQLSDLRIQYGLSEYQFHSWIVIQKQKANGIDIGVAQKIATSVWKATESVLFRKGKTIHFLSFDQFLSLEGKTNNSGIRYKKGRVYWLGLCIQPQLRKDDVYAREALNHRVKYCRIIRKPIGVTYHYYLQLVLEGIPPQKHHFLPDGYVGIDQGVSTEAIVSEKGCILTELSEDRRNIQKQVARIQRRMERSRRQSNPENYHPDGTVKRGKRFINSKSYKRDRMRLKTLYRRASDQSKQFAERLANTVLCEHGTWIITEPMSYKGLQRRSKETKISERTGRHQSKKRYGTSIGTHAPARFLAVLNRKLGYINKTVQIVDSNQFRASQYDHVLDTYEKQDLSSRSKYIGETHVQRDLYSAFLLSCARTPEKPDRDLCEQLFPSFLKAQEETFRTLLTSQKHYPSCMGLSDFCYLTESV